MTRPVIVVGGGGHARVVVDALLTMEESVQGFTDPEDGVASEIWGVPHLGDDRVVEEYAPDEVVLANGVGSVGRTDRRERVFREFRSQGYEFVSIVHPAAIISPRTHLEEGIQVMMGAVLQAGVHLGPNVLVNSSASVDHDCRLDAHVHVAPGALLSGDVRVGRGALVGVGASVRQGLTVGENSIVGAGAVAVRDVDPNITVVGVPAEPLAR